MQAGDIVTTTEALTVIRRTGQGPETLYLPVGTYCKVERREGEGTRVKLLTLGRSALLPSILLCLAWRPRVPPEPSFPPSNQLPDVLRLG